MSNAARDAMHIERVHFDEIFDTHAGRGDFSFRSAGQVRYGVQLRRRAVPRPGSTYIFALAGRDDWSSPLGWMDVQTGTISLKNSTWLEVLSGLASFIWLAPFFLAGALLLGGPGMALAVLLAICCACSWLLYRFVDRNRRIRDALREAGAESTSRQPCANRSRF
jgi:hypothetical protein